MGCKHVIYSSHEGNGDKNVTHPQQFPKIVAIISLISFNHSLVKLKISYDKCTS
jgi:hypothetical protein